MRSLIVYYSLEGNTEYAVNRIKEKTGFDELRLVPKKAYKDKGFSKFVWGGKSALMGEKPKLENYEVDLASYDRIIFSDKESARKLGEYRAYYERYLQYKYRQ